MTKNDIKSLITAGVTMQDVYDELEYREQANGMKWNDELYAYSTEELEEIEEGDLLAQTAFEVREVFADGKTFIRFTHTDRFDCEVWAEQHKYDRSISGKLRIFDADAKKGAESMTQFVFNRYVYRYYWDTHKCTRTAQRKNGKEREIGESLYNCMNAAHTAKATHK